MSVVMSLCLSCHHLLCFASLQRLQELIEDQTGISVNHQWLVIGFEQLSTRLEANQNVVDCLVDISRVNPIIVFNTTLSVPQKPYMPAVGKDTVVMLPWLDDDAGHGSLNILYWESW